MATNMFVEFSGIKGECDADSHHKGWCEITDLEQDFSNPTFPLPPPAKEVPGATPCKHEEIKIKKLVDKASAGLMVACWKGETVKEVKIECFRAGKGLKDENQPIKYFSIELKWVIIKEFAYSVSEGELVSEDLELVALEATYKYWQMDKKLGTVNLAGYGTATPGQGNS